MPFPSMPEPETFAFADDDSFRNNPALSFPIERGGIDRNGSPDPEEPIESTFASNDCRAMWRSGIYRYVLYHAMIDEPMGLARGRARVQFGGEAKIDIFAGGVCVLPPGKGHQWIGPYPPGGKYDLCRSSKAEHARAIPASAEVPMRQTDPVFGRPTRLWRP